MSGWGYVLTGWVVGIWTAVGVHALGCYRGGRR